MLIKYCQTIQGPHLEATAFRREMISQSNTVWWLVKSTKVQTMFWQLVKKTVLQPIALHLGRWIIKATPLDTCANTRWIGELKMKIMKCANTCWIGELKMKIMKCANTCWIGELKMTIMKWTEAQHVHDEINVPCRWSSSNYGPTQEGRWPTDVNEAAHYQESSISHHEMGSIQQKRGGKWEGTVPFVSAREKQSKLSREPAFVGSRGWRWGCSCGAQSWFVGCGWTVVKAVINNVGGELIRGS